MSEISQRIMDAMFTQQRLQVLSLGVHHNEFSDAYLYAWAKGVYPFNDDTDGSVARRPHEHYAEYFRVSQEKVDELSEYLDDCWVKKAVPTFDELERHFGVVYERTEWKRSELLKICRYLFLDGSWEQSFWDTLLTPTKYPSEAGSIIRDFDRQRDIDFGW
ncbi:hypothetical protein [Aeromonas veronii]|uniref:hypothetical protein n=1 Tax=Aeromonas veronii TaxID=654 RepID=UPI0039F6C053